jgi:CRISPR-associated protein Csb3
MTAGAAIQLRIEATNPGQFFACCGLLELADRVWSGAQAWFDSSGQTFFLRGWPETPAPPAMLLTELARCPLTNVMTAAQVARRRELSAKPRKEREAAIESEKKGLDALYREAPLLLGEPFELRVDWFLDDRAGGDAFKTWAGQQSVLDIALGMKAALEAEDWSRVPPSDWLSQSTGRDGLPFNFDANLGDVGSDLDVGFSFDPLTALKLRELRLRTRPLIEFGAFAGLQRFRPMRVERENRYRYCTWGQPLFPELACVAASGFLPAVTIATFEFRLLYRTKYLKSFLPATALTRS